MFNSLYTLIDDARSLRDYAATALGHVHVSAGDMITEWGHTKSRMKCQAFFTISPVPCCLPMDPEEERLSLKDSKGTEPLYIPSDPQECFSVALSAFDGPGEMQPQSGLQQVFGTSNAMNPPVEKKVGRTWHC